MATEASLVHALVTIAFGAIAGGTTNAVAIWMLFHPYERRGPGPFKFQGAVPKNKARLAKTIGRTVGQRLLSAKDLTQQLGTPETRAAFDRAVDGFVHALLDRERGPMRESLPEGLRGELDDAVRAIGNVIADRTAEYLRSDAFPGTVAGLLQRARDDVADRPVGEVLTDARREAIRDRVEHWVSNAAQSPELESTIRSWLERQSTRLAGDDTPLLDRLPPDLVAAVEREMAGYLPLAIDRLAALLRDPESRARLQHALHQLFERYVQDLLLHERIVARLIVTEKTLAKLLDTVDRQGLDQLTALLDEPEMRTRVARSINDAVVNFLRRPLREHVERLGPERVQGIIDTAAHHITAALRDPTTRGYAIERLDRALIAAEHRTWGELLQYLPPDKAATWLADAARAPRVRTWISDGAVLALTSLTNRPLGRPADWLPEGTPDRLARDLSPLIWSWIQEQLPEVIEQVDVQGMVEQKVLGFSLARIEEIVRSTSQKELDLIVRLGYVLGAIVGFAAYGMSLLLP
ncbi:MAG TPA: DUF445 family protein [Gemmatimonadales bacterium]